MNFKNDSIVQEGSRGAEGILRTVKAYSPIKQPIRSLILHRLLNHLEYTAMVWFCHTVWNWRHRAGGCVSGHLGGEGFRQHVHLPAEMEWNRITQDERKWDGIKWDRVKRKMIYLNQGVLNNIQHKRFLFFDRDFQKFLRSDLPPRWFEWNGKEWNTKWTIGMA